jgi:hypothetical protein
VKNRTFITFIGIFFLLSGCSNSCESAKQEVIKYTEQYLQAIYNGKQGASVPGGSEAIAALAKAKIACNRSDLTVEEIILQSKNKK